MKEKLPPRLRAKLRKAIAPLQDALGHIVKQSRSSVLRMTLGTRILIILVSIASASTVITLTLQDNSLRADLEKAARQRLEDAAETASQLIDEFLVSKLETYRVVASTPQFLSNLESKHRPTLQHFAGEIIRKLGTETVIFLDPQDKIIALAGHKRLADVARSQLHAARIRGGHAGANGPTRSTSSLLAHDGVPHSLISIPIGNEGSRLGRFVALDAIHEADLRAWSKLSRATLVLEEPKEGTHVALPVRPVGNLQFRVQTSFEPEKNALANSRRTLITGGILALALASAASIFFARSIVRPIRVIQAATERIGNGDLHFRLDTRRSDEVGDVASGLNLMLDHLEKNISERLKVEHQISHLAYHDSLTGLGNRRLLRERLGTAIDRAQEEDRSVAVIFMDLDRFKNVNDTLGHTAGDELLIEVANRLDACVQTVNQKTGEDEEEALLARLGGDEFTVLLPDIEEREKVEQLANLIIEALSSPFTLRGQEVAVSASLGISISPDDAEDVETLLRDSDMAMFHAKNQGGRGYEFFADSMQEIAARRLNLENKLQRALENDEFELYYQPKIGLAQGQMKGVEALIRWHDPVRGLVSPDEFIPMAEETGAIIPLGEWVLKEAMSQCLRWQAEGLPPTRVAVNVSVRQIEHREDFVEKVAALLEETGLDPSLLEIEITEGALLRDEDATIALLDKLKGMGLRLSLDDFGTGYSSLSYLRRLPIDSLKIDRSFIQGADHNDEDAALIESIVAMAKVLNLRVIVEGVETRKQQRFLAKLGCDEIQGFLFSEPVTADSVSKILRCKSTRFRTDTPGVKTVRRKSSNKAASRKRSKNKRKLGSSRSSDRRKGSRASTRKKASRT